MLRSPRRWRSTDARSRMPHSPDSAVMAGMPRSAASAEVLPPTVRLGRRPGARRGRGRRRERARGPGRRPATRRTARTAREPREGRRRAGRGGSRSPAMNCSVTAAAMRSAAVPAASPGNERLRFLPSKGTTKGDRAQKAGRLTTGTTVIWPESSAARSSSAHSRAAAIEVYSVPCTPAITVSRGPRPAVPTTSTYGIASGPSPPSSTTSSRTVHRTAPTTLSVGALHSVRRSEQLGDDADSSSSRLHCRRVVSRLRRLVAVALADGCGGGCGCVAGTPGRRWPEWRTMQPQ